MTSDKKFLPLENENEKEREIKKEKEIKKSLKDMCIFATLGAPGFFMYNLYKKYKKNF